MAEHNETDSDCPGDGWLSSWEKKCLDEWEKESAFEDRLQVDNEKTSQKIWQSFQNSATAVSRLFKGSMNVRNSGCKEYVTVTSTAALGLQDARLAVSVAGDIPS